jgi:hypothetical protein
MDSIRALMSKIRARPGMYIGRPSVTRLMFILYGYDHALWEAGPGRTDLVLGEFRDWIQQRFHSTTVSWEDLILRNSADEADAFRRFWVLWDEFSTERQRNAPPASASFSPVA